MSTCLITKLTESVNDPKLLRINEIHLKVNTSAMKSITFAYQSSNVDCRIVGDGHFTDSTGAENYGKAHSYGEPYIVYFSAGEYDLYVSSKHTFNVITFPSCSKGELLICDRALTQCENLYAVTLGSVMGDGELFNLATDIVKDNIKSFRASYQASAGGETVVGNLRDFKLDQMVSIFVQTQLVDCDLDDLVPNSSMTTLRVGGLNAAVVGDVEKFGINLPNLTTLYVNGYGSGDALTGTLESLLNAMVAGGRSSGTLDVRFQGAARVRYNNAWVGDSIKYVTFGSQYPNGWNI